MNAKPIGLLTLALVGLLLAAVACGDDGEPAIRVEKGLAAAGGAPGAEQVVPPVPFPGDRGGEIGFAQPVPAPFGFQQGQTGINVQGFGSATAPADNARILFFLESFFEPEPFPVPPPPGRRSFPEPEEFPEPQRLTEEDLDPIVEAIKEQGIPEDAIQVTIGQRFAPTTARITVTTGDVDRVPAIIDAATEAAEDLEAEVFLNSSVLYTVDDCAPLEREAIRASVEDARDRAQLVADVLEVDVGQATFVSQFFQSPFGFSGCDPSAVTFEREFFEFGGMPFEASQPAEVTLISGVSIIFAIQ